MKTTVQYLSIRAWLNVTQVNVQKVEVKSSSQHLLSLGIQFSCAKRNPKEAGRSLSFHNEVSQAPQYLIK